MDAMVKTARVKLCLFCAGFQKGLGLVPLLFTASTAGRDFLQGQALFGSAPAAGSCC